MNSQFLQYVRHLSKQDKKSLSQKALKTCEEAGELAKVILPFDNAYATTHRFIAKENILEEAVDVMLTALSIAYDLDFTDDEIDAMLNRKAEKWGNLQVKENRATYPLPYEIHVTVRLDKDANPAPQIDWFVEACKEIDVKPIVLDLQRRNGSSAMMDVMTSSKHYGNNASAYMAAEKIRQHLSQHRAFTVVRVKIETVPWHPAAPYIDTDIMPANCYFESHIPITIRTEDILTLKNICEQLQLHLSRNTFKQNPDGTIVIMTTFRSSVMVGPNFQQHVTDIRTKLIDHGLIVGKSIVEFSVYDTKVSHDSEWIKNT